MTINRYLGNIDMDAKTDEIRTFIEGKGVKVIELEQNATKHQRFKSYRLRIRKADVSKTDDPEFWPTDVMVRQYFRPKTTRNGEQWRNSAADKDGDGVSTESKED